MLRLLPGGFRSRELREHLARLLGDDPSQWTSGRLTYQLRRLRLHGLIERIEGTQRYSVTERGYQVALWFSR
jgi:DNA-binding HxlR family transcriptional regulator